MIVMQVLWTPCRQMHLNSKFLVNSVSPRIHSPSPPKYVRNSGTSVICASRVKFSSSLTTDLPLREPFGIPFEDYLKEDKRVLRAFFPDEQRSEQISKDTWRIYMLPIGFFLLSVRPVIDMQILLSDEPSSSTSTRVLSLKAVGWELRGADVLPADFQLSVEGALFAEKRGASKRLQGKMGVSIDFDIPSNLSLFPAETIEAVGASLMDQLLQNMKEKVNGRVLEDYAKFAREKSRLKRKI